MGYGKKSFKWQNPNFIAGENNWPWVENMILSGEPQLLAYRIASLSDLSVIAPNCLETVVSHNKLELLAHWSLMLWVLANLWCSNVAAKRCEGYNKSSRNLELCGYYGKHSEEKNAFNFFFFSPKVDVKTMYMIWDLSCSFLSWFL